MNQKGPERSASPAAVKKGERPEMKVYAYDQTECSDGKISW